MSLHESRNARREARKAALQTVAPSLDSKPSRRSPLRRSMIAASALALFLAMLVATPKSARAGLETPEIDPGSMAGAMTLLVGGVLALTDRSRRS